MSPDQPLFIPFSVASCSYSCPHQLLIERDLRFRCSHLREEGREGFNEIEKADCNQCKFLFSNALLWRYSRPDMIVAGALFQGKWKR